MKKTVQNYFAFPHKVKIPRQNNLPEEIYFNGMSKRFFAACMAMQGFLASPMTIKTSEELAKRSFEAADGLLKWEENDLGKN